MIGRFIYPENMSDNTKFTYLSNLEQNPNFVYKELSEIAPARKDVNISIAIMEAIRMSENKKSKNIMEKRRYK